MRRVALVSPYALSVPGGVQEQILSMSRELSRRGHEVLVLSPDESDVAHYDTPASVLRLGRLASVPANGSRAPLTLSWSASRRARAALASFGATLVHFHEPFAPVLGWSSLWAHRIPAVGTLHRAGVGPAISLTRPLLRALSKRVDVLAAVSAAAASTWSAPAGVDPVVLFNGFELERFVEPARRVPERPSVLFVGRFEERKGASDVLRAVQIHNATHPADPWNLVLAGDGPQRATLEALAGDDEHVSLPGAVSDEHKRDLLRSASVAVAASTHGESFGLVVLEPMAAGVPVVASDIEGYREAAGTQATFFRAGDPRSLEAAVREALATASPQRVLAARAHAERWSMSALMDAYEDLYARAEVLFGRLR